MRVAIAAHKVRGIRAALAHDHYTAHQMVEHDDVNARRLAKVLAIEARSGPPAGPPGPGQGFDETAAP